MVSPEIVPTRLPRSRSLDNSKPLTQNYYQDYEGKRGKPIVGGIPKTVYAQNDVCWIRVHGQKKLFRGHVCGQLSDPGVTGVYYVIKLDNFTWPYFEIRDSSLMSETANGILPSADEMFNPDLRTPTGDERQNR